jgi:hypothetical protein
VNINETFAHVVKFHHWMHYHNMSTDGLEDPPNGRKITFLIEY